MNVIRGIRNEFAHNFDHRLSFGDQSIADRCRNLKTAKVLIEANEHAASTPNPNCSSELIRAMGSVFKSPRQRYEVSVELIAQHLEDLGASEGEYDGPNWNDELWELGSRFSQVRMSGTGTANEPSVDPP